MLPIVTMPPTGPLCEDGSKRGGWWHATEDAERIVCDLCPRECTLKPGDRGFCFVRENRDGEMVLTTYGRSTGFCIDPIEKKPLNHFLPGTSVLSFGTAGCNLGCKFCQNWSISKSREVERLSETATPEAIAAACQEMGCRSVAFTYNDPIIWAEYAIDVARACRAVDVKTVAVTAGYITEAARRPFFDAIDAANVDLKAFTEEFYQKLTLSHIQPVLDTLSWLKRETEVWFEITNLVIPQANDSDDEFRRMCDWVLDHVGDEVPLHFTAFHPDFRLRDRERTPHETLLRAYQLARHAGVKHVYVGNVNDLRHQSTYCPVCRGMLIERDWYELGAYHLDGNRCRHCGATIAGVFDQAPGTWGRKRLPVQIANFVPKPPVVEASREFKTNVRQPLSQAPPASNERNVNVSTTESASTFAQPSAPELTDEQQNAIHRAASELVAAAVTGYRAEASEPTLAGAGGQTILGCFVTLKRQGRLRGCCGFLGRPTTILAALTEAAVTTATRDARLPTISPIELEHLTLDVSLLHSIKRIEATGDGRIQAVAVGKHGLQIVRGEARGLLLPSVATENDLDAEEFLRQVSMKAGLPPTAWKEEQTGIWTFEGLAIPGKLEPDVVERFRVEQPARFTTADVAKLAEFCRQNIVALAAGGTPTYYAANCPDGTVEGITISVSLPGRDAPARFGQLSMRPGLPLQSTALEMCKLAAAMLNAGGYQAAHLYDLKVDLAVLFDPAMHGTVAEPALEGFDPQQRALFSVRSQQVGLGR